MRHSQWRWIAPAKWPAHWRWMIAVDGANATLAMGVVGLLAVLARELGHLVAAVIGWVVLKVMVRRSPWLIGGCTSGRRRCPSA